MFDRVGLIVPRPPALFQAAWTHPVFVREIEHPSRVEARSPIPIVESVALRNCLKPASRGYRSPAMTTDRSSHRRKLVVREVNRRSKEKGA
jgi:hypothetical protein